MSDNSLLRLNSLYLQNYRCFSSCKVDFHPYLTVLVAENGRGKTAILDAATIALDLFVDTISNTKVYKGFNNHDVRLEYRQGKMLASLPTELTATGLVLGRELTWIRTRRGITPRHRTSTNRAIALQKSAQQLREDVDRSQIERPDEPSVLPLLALYGAGRAWSGNASGAKTSVRYTPEQPRIAGYNDCFSSLSSVGDLANWYESKANAIRDPRFSNELSQNLLLLNAVREATRAVLAPTGWCMLDWDFGQRQLVVEHKDQGRLPLREMSDGVRNMVALVADVARRCTILNPHMREKSATLTPGILLIDEIDAHLHPSWQQQIIELLCAAFPSMQIILSTHSPHVLSTVNKDSVRIVHIENGIGTLKTPKYQTRGVESADVLASIMGVDPSPRIPEAKMLSEYRAQIQKHLFGTSEFEELKAKLEQHFGDKHPVMLDCERLIRLEKFKSTLPPIKSRKEF